jgi:hypothetical protein
MSIHIPISIDISLEDIQSLFQYDILIGGVDQNNIGTYINDNENITDIHYYLDASKFPNLDQGFLSDRNLDTDNNMDLKRDYISYVAKNIFNTERGVDLFNNESDFINDFTSKCATFWTSVSSNVYNIDKNNGTIYDGIDVNNNKYLTNSIISRHPEINLTRELMKQLAADHNGRFLTMDRDTSTGLYKVPFETEDKIYFTLIIHSDPAQTSIIGNNPGSAITDRSYKIILNVVP